MLRLNLEAQLMNRFVNISVLTAILVSGQGYFLNNATANSTVNQQSGVAAKSIPCNFSAEYSSNGQWLETEYELASDNGFSEVVQDMS